MNFLINDDSPYFYGYIGDSSDGRYICGYFNDHELPSVTDLHNKINDYDFKFWYGNFLEWLQLDDENDDVTDYYELGPRLYPLEIQISKNEQVIARAGFRTKKYKGYFQEALYKHVVENVSDAGFSNLRISIASTNFGEHVTQEIIFRYENNPHNNSIKNMEHYTKVCSLLTPFLNVIEEHFLNQELFEEINLPHMLEEVDNSFYHDSNWGKVPWVQERDFPLTRERQRDERLLRGKEF